jgi:AcrR family transcriptional regulator
MPDHARTLELLWGTTSPGPRRGPRPALTVPEVVRAAVAIADREGLEALTMRRLARELGVGPMALYTYVPGKAELLDLMLDAVYLEMPRNALPGDWRERLTAVARDNRALFEAHPWAATLSSSRPPLGPGLMAKYEHELAALADSGLDDVQTDAALTFLLDFVRSSALAAQGAAYSPDHAWEFGLERVLDGLGTLIERYSCRPH